MDSDIAGLREQIEELRLRQNGRSQLSVRVDVLIKEIEREDDRVSSSSRQ